MVSYPFVCDVCGHEFEKKLNINDISAQIVCPEGHTRVHRIYHAPTVIYKGSGFYSTDHRK